MVHKVNTSVEGMGTEINIYADPQTLRDIANQMEQSGSVWVEGHAIDVDEPAQIVFSAYVEHDEDYDDGDDEGDED